jgi:AraC-like DNA-binding protein
MRKQKLLFNELLRRFNKYTGKLVRFMAEGKNLRKQDILQRRLQKMHALLLSLQKAIRLAASAAAVANVCTPIRCTKPA